MSATLLPSSLLQSPLLPHLLRPAWLLGWLALPLIAWWWHARQRHQNPWRRVVDPHLLPSLLDTGVDTAARTPWLMLFTIMLAVFALAGPSWHHEIAALIAPADPLVIAVDLSSAMQAADLPPSRNARMRIKLRQLLEQRRGGQLGLVAYAGAAFTVAPLSTDARSLDDLVDALLPAVIPVDGQRADQAITRSADLLQQAGFAHGRIVLLTDHADDAAISAARTADTRGYHTSVLGVGTLAGAPVADSDAGAGDNDTLHMARLEPASLRSLATAGDGRYAPMSVRADDLQLLDLLDAHATDDSTESASSTRDAAISTRWRDDGSWLVLLLLPLALLGFRRNAWMRFALVLLLMPLPRAQAATPEWWSRLWQSNDQRAYQALQQHPQQAESLAHSPEIAAAAAYRQGDFQRAEKLWAPIASADALFNRGNALAKMQDYQGAISAYDRALQVQPGMPDAQANRSAVQRLLQQQKQQQQQQQQKKDGKDGKEGKQDHQGNAQGSQSQGSDQQNPQHDGSSGQQGQQQGQQPRQPGEQSGQQDATRQSQQAGEQGQQPTPGQRQAQQSNTPSQARPKQSSFSSKDAAPSPQPATAEDAAAQRERQAKADAATRRAMQDALQRQQGKVPSQQAKQKGYVAGESTAQREQQQAIEQWLQRVPDDPGGLLRRKFAIEWARRQAQGEH